MNLKVGAVVPLKTVEVPFILLVVFLKKGWFVDIQNLNRKVTEMLTINTDGAIYYGMGATQTSASWGFTAVGNLISSYRKVHESN